MALTEQNFIVNHIQLEDTLCSCSSAVSILTPKHMWKTNKLQSEDYYSTKNATSFKQIMLKRQIETTQNHLGRLYANVEYLILAILLLNPSVYHSTEH